MVCQPRSAYHTCHLPVGHTTGRLSYCQGHTLKSKEGDVLSDPRTRPNRNKASTDPFLIFVHLTCWMSSRKETLIRALLGLLKDYSTETPVEIVFIKLKEEFQ